mmetsp:Transcript_113748/g.223113  ORF Transcript_113748/g.223113 Transcript_113748/m.223113 type:complete len:257 (-) Transcript_113748:33-803(-)
MALAATRLSAAFGAPLRRAVVPLLAALFAAVFALAIAVALPFAPATLAAVGAAFPTVGAFAAATFAFLAAALLPALAAVLRGLRRPAADAVADAALGDLEAPRPPLEGHAVDFAAYHDAFAVVHSAELADLSHPPVLPHLRHDVGGALFGPKPERRPLQAVKPPVVQGEPALLLLEDLAPSVVQQRPPGGLVAQLALPPEDLDGREGGLEPPSGVVQLRFLGRTPDGLHRLGRVLDQPAVREQIPHLLLRETDLHG